MSKIEAKKQPKKFKSLAVVLATTFFILVSATLIISGAFSLYFNFIAHRQAITNEQQLVASDAANTVKNFIQEKFSKLETASVFSNVEMIGQKEQKQILDKLLGLEPAFRQLLLLNAQEEELVRVSSLSMSLSVKAMEYRKSEVFSKVSQKERYIGPVYIDEVTYEPMMVIGIPIVDAFHDFKGILIAEVNLKFMWDLISQIKIGETGTAYVVTRQGDLIAFGDISRVLKGKNLSNLKEVDKFIKGEQKKDIAAKGIQDNYVISAYAAIGTPDWAVITELPIKEAYNPLINQIILIVIIIFIIFCLATMVVIYLSKRITRPIVNLRDVALEISKGKLDTKAEIKSKDEIGELAESFNSMAGELAKSIHKLREEEARLIASINSLPLGFAIADVKGAFIITNPVLLNLFSLNKKTLSFSDISARLPDKIGSKKFNLDIAREQVLHDKETIEIKKVPFENKFVRMFLSPIIFTYKGGEEVIGIVFLAEDITEQQRLDEAKTSFVAITAHELRTPLAVIRGNAELLLEMFPKKFEDPQAKTMVDAIQRNSIRLLGIINDFLDLTFLEEHRIQLKNEKFDVVSVVNEIVEDFKPKADEKSLFLRLESPAEPLPEIFADRERVKEIIVNVLSNAIQYTEKGGVTLSLAKNNEFVELSIKDTGIGIKESDQKLLFQKFQTVKGRFMHSKEYGSGMGLYISKLLAELMNADVKLKESTPGVGSTFVIVLPVSST